MTSNPAHPATFRPGPLMVQVVACSIAGSLLGLGIGYAATWGQGSVSKLALSAAASGGAWVIGAALGGLFLILNTNRETIKLPLGVLASSTVRMLVALFLGLALYLPLPLDGRCFWTSFLLSGLLALLAETTWALRTINPGRAHGPAGEAGVS